MVAGDEAKGLKTFSYHILSDHTTDHQFLLRRLIDEKRRRRYNKKGGRGTAAQRPYERGEVRSKLPATTAGDWLVVCCTGLLSTRLRVKFSASSAGPAFRATDATRTFSPSRLSKAVSSQHESRLWRPRNEPTVFHG